MANMLQQPFDVDGRLLCLACGKNIEHGDFCVEIVQHCQDDVDSKLLVHLGCIGELQT